MAETSRLRRPRSAPALDNQAFLWLIVITGWIFVILWVALTMGRHLWHHRPSISSEPPGRFLRVEAVKPSPLALRFQDAAEVGLAGIAAPDGSEPLARATARISELTPAGAFVYVELDPVGSAGSDPPPAYVWLIPHGVEAVLPFAHEKAQLLNAILVQEGLVTVASGPSFYRTEFEMLQDDARRHERGLWATP